MELNSIFKSSAAVEFEYEDSKWQILPYLHEQVFENLLEHLPLDRADIIMKFMVDRHSKEINTSDYFKTTGEMWATLGLVSASHVVGWSNVTLNGEEVPFDFATVHDVIKKHPAIKKWIDDNAISLVNAKADAEEKKAAIKKKSRNTSIGKSSGDDSEAHEP